ncbi:hypothetical protein PV328_004337 [Microctonus aethiopoides]|uniref:Uncharacterized protein n=1 Tax=Microctonus aethiopoides TaxID=144406 RepID=A0AA39FAB1_9HYME|nr:hypothetical protein PV328_004337 [Microctonus aethiopoides]
MSALKCSVNPHVGSEISPIEDSQELENDNVDVKAEETAGNLIVKATEEQQNVMIEDSQKLKNGNVDVEAEEAAGNPIAKTTEEQQSVTMKESQNSENGNVAIKTEEVAENPKTNEEEQSVSIRFGPAVKKYLLEFIDYLRCRTGFKFENWTTPNQLEKTMKKMEVLQVPMDIWRAFINCSIRLLGLSDNKYVMANEFIKALVVTLSFFADFYLENCLLRFAMRAVSYFSNKYLTPLIIAIYHFLNYSMKKLWVLAQKKIEEYSPFILDKLQISFAPRLQ